MSHLNYQLEIIRFVRKKCLDLLEECSIQELNKIPKGFNNNLIWNYGHIIVTQQLLTYNRSSLSLLISDELIVKYRKGTKPEGFVPASDYQKLKDLASHSIDQTALDLARGAFSSYQTYTTSSGMVLSNIEEAIAFNCYHESLHYGTMLGLSKSIVNE